LSCALSVFSMSLSLPCSFISSAVFSMFAMLLFVHAHRAIDGLCRVPSFWAHTAKSS
jgi:hypothetical protein